MSESTPSSGDRPSGDLAEELRKLGNNLREILQSAWESEERRKLQQEIETGLTQLGSSLDRTVTEFRESPEGQRLKAEADDFRQRLHSGEVESKVREDILSILRKVNAELQKAASSGKENETEQEDLNAG